MSKISLDYSQRSRCVPLETELYYFGQFNGYDLTNEARIEIQSFPNLYTKSTGLASRILYLAQQKPVSERIIGIN